MITLHYRGKDLPTAKTLAAFIDFKREAGYDLIKNPEAIDTEGLAIFAWCSLRAAAELRGEVFADTLREFTLHADINALNAWYLAIMTDGEVAEGTTDKKK